MRKCYPIGKACIGEVGIGILSNFRWTGPDTIGDEDDIKKLEEAGGYYDHSNTNHQLL